MQVKVWVALAVLGLTGCAGTPDPKSSAAVGVHAGVPGPAAWVADAIAGDGPGWRSPSQVAIPVTVENLPKSRRGNPSEYTVGGVPYRVLDSAEGYREQGHASWYGRKFHGRETSSGEVYDMYELTAAHKHLPLPTFVRVTRTDTGDSIVVKVNDRGPFVPGRIIDLSYQAAASLGIVKSGTAPVIIEALSTHLPTKTTNTASVPVQTLEPKVAEVQPATPNSIVARDSTVLDEYVQLGAFNQSANAQKMLDSLGGSLPRPVRINFDQAQSLYKVWVGPLESPSDKNGTLAALQAQGVTNYTIVISGR